MRKKNKSKRQRGHSSGSKKVPQKKTSSPARTTKQAGAPAAVLDSAKLRSLYAMMLKCRRLSERNRKSSSNRSITGREAVLVGAASHALPEDKVIAGDASLQSLLAQLFSHLQTNNAFDHSALERGMSLANELKGQGKAVLAFCSADMTPDEIGNVLGQAAREKLPLVCVVEMAIAVIDAEQARQRDGNPAKQDMATYFPRIAAHGTDVVAMFRVAQEAVRRARGGHGPSLIQCVMPDTVHGVRNEENDALAFMERYLRRRKLWSDELRANYEADVKV